MIRRTLTAAVLLLALAACQTAPTPTSPPPAAKPGGAAPTAAAKPAGKDEGQRQTLGSATYDVHGTQDVAGKDQVEVEADSFYFEPTFLRGTPGQKVKLEVDNESGVAHNFSVDEQKIDKDVPANGKTTVDLTFPSSGVVRFYCKFHAGQGMDGQLLAGPATPQPAGAGQASTRSIQPTSPSGYGY